MNISALRLNFRNDSVNLPLISFPPPIDFFARVKIKRQEVIEAINIPNIAPITSLNKRIEITPKSNLE